MSELKNCPFCDGVPEIKTTSGDTSGPGSIIVSCTVCGISFDNIAIKKHLWSNPDNGSYKSDVIDQWNTRQIPEGYQLVPVEATRRMINAGNRNMPWPADMYKAMLKAAGDQDEN